MTVNHDVVGSSPTTGANLKRAYFYLGKRYKQKLFSLLKISGYKKIVYNGPRPKSGRARFFLVSFFDPYGNEYPYKFNPKQKPLTIEQELMSMVVQRVHIGEEITVD